MKKLIFIVSISLIFIGFFHIPPVDANEAFMKEVELPLNGETLLTNNTLIYSENSDGIYVIKEGKKRPIPSIETFLSLGYNLSDVLLIQESDFQSIPSGEVLPLPGGSVVRAYDNERVYLIEDGERRYIPSPDIFFGAGYVEDDIISVTSDTLNDHPVGDDYIDPNWIPNGDFVFVSGGEGVFKIEDNTARPIPNITILLNHTGDNVDKVRQVEAEQFSSIPTAKMLFPRSGTIVSHLDDLYLVDNDNLISINDKKELIESSRIEEISSLVFQQMQQDNDNLFPENDNLFPEGEYDEENTSVNTRDQITAWIERNQLNQYGDRRGTEYSSGDPLAQFNGSLEDYLHVNYPETPWLRDPELPTEYVIQTRYNDHISRKLHFNSGNSLWANDVDMWRFDDYQGSQNGYTYEDNTLSGLGLDINLDGYIYDIVNTDNEAYGLLDNNQGIKLNGGIEDYPVSRDRINVNDASAQAFKGQEVSNTGDRLYIYQDNTVQAFNNLTGDFLWQYDAQGKIYDIGVDQGIYIITDNNGFIQLNSDGEVVVARQHNVFDFSDRTIDNYPQLLSGKKKTEENVSFSEQDFYPPDIPYYEYQDTVFVLSEDSHILALNSQDGDIRWTIEQDDSLSVKLDPRSDRGGLYVSNIRQVNRGLTEKINPQNGNALWSYGDKYTQDCSFSMYQIRDYCWYNSTITDVSYDGDRLYMYINAIDNPQITEGILVSLDTETGLEQWEKISSDFVMEDSEKIYLQEGAVIWSGPREELMGHKIYAQIRSGNTFNLLQIDGKTGGIDWERSLADEMITHNQHIIPDVDLRYIYLLEMNKQGNNNQDTTVGIRVIDTEDGSNEDLYAQRSLLPDNVNDEEGNYLPESLYQQNTLYADHEFNIYWHTKHGQESEYFSGIYSIFRPDGDMNWMFDFRTGAQSSDGFFGKVEE